MAALAGVPKEVVGRAREILSEIESVGGRVSEKPAAAPAPTAAEQELCDRLRALNVETITPIEAMSILYELKNASAAAAGEKHSVKIAHAENGSIPILRPNSA